MRRWDGTGSSEAFKKWARKPGAYWMRSGQDDHWHVVMLDTGRGYRAWGECSNCGDGFWDEIMASWEVVGPIPEPSI